MNDCVLRRQKNKRLIIPARIFGYLALCEHLKQNIRKVIEKATVNSTNLPFVSSITNEFTPYGAVYAHWSFLKYSH